MEWKDLPGELVQFITEVSPELWMIAQRQVIVYTIQSAAICIVFVIVSIILARFALKLGEEDEYEAALTVWALMTILSVSVFFMLAGIAGRLANPDYYTVKTLLDMVTQ